VLDLVNPIGPGGRLDRTRRDTGGHEAAGDLGNEHAANLLACPILRQRPDCRCGGTCELAYHGPPTAYFPPRRHHLPRRDFGRNGRAYLETDTAEADRETIIRNFISGQYDRPVRVVAFNTAEGWSRDVSEDIAHEVLDQAHGADEVLTDGTKSLIDRHIIAGEKRPPAPSVRRGVDQAARRKA
jgi:hypothetical protein